ncbi:MAG: PAS domain-containing protein [Rhodospirillaceae bacterium]|nr:PAS domain-containing protein [Rhodospirillaceae bacterium]
MSAAEPNPSWTEHCHPDIRAMYHYWLGKKGQRTMPSRRDIDPGEIKRFLPHVTLVDVVDDERRYVYRLVGTKEVELRGNDPTGQSVLTAYFAVSSDDALAHYDATRQSRAPHYVADPFQTVDRYVGEEDLFLPLSDDGETVNIIMVFSTVRDLFEAPPFGL